MVTVNDVKLPDDVYARIEQRARENGVTVAEQLARDVQTSAEKLAASVKNHVQQGEEENLTEEALLAAIRRDREAMAARGVHLTDEFLHQARNWGRK